MEIDSAPVEPALPFLRINKYHVIRIDHVKFNGRSSYEWHILRMTKREYEKGLFKEDTHIIDINCWKFPIIDVLNTGRSWSLWDILGGPEYAKLQYVYGVPTKLSFDAAREEIVELICSKGWYNQTQDRESEAQFRERMGLCENMHDLIMGRQIHTGAKAKYHWIGGISYRGKWVG